MPATVVNEYTPDVVSPPRATLSDLMEERGISQAELARRMGKTAKALGEILSDTEDVAITPDTAVQLEQALGLPARFWINREASYREAQAKQRLRRDCLDSVDWLDELPLAELRRRGHVRSRGRGADAVREALAFFGVASVGAWRQFWSRSEVTYRMAPEDPGPAGALAAWLREGELAAAGLAVGFFDADAFESEVAALATQCAEAGPLSRAVLAERLGRCGVALVSVAPYRGLAAIAATRWVHGGRTPLIQLAEGRREPGRLAFHLLHAACHILRHPKRPIYLDADAPGGVRIEDEANRFAETLLAG
jgi:plasmid maintenance system antidote protein VapI